jgi:ABC-type uncharacterized transport system auxiliary subunit
MIFWRDAMKTLKVIFALAAICLTLAGCGKRAIVRRYYLLEIPATVSAKNLTAPQPLSFSADVRDFEVVKAFDQTRIAARSGSNEIDYYFHHHWAVRPSMALADMVGELIDRAGLFQHCTRGYSYRPDYIITGQVLRLERVLTDTPDVAHLAAVFVLVDVAGEQPVVRHEFDRSMDLRSDRSMNGFANAISDIISQETQVFIGKIEAHFQQK